MKSHLGSRLAQIVPTLLLVSVLVFCLQFSSRLLTLASLLGFLTALFPKAGVKIGSFPFPFLLFGLIVTALLVVLVPITWRLALIVIIPTLIAATYAGYRDIYS